MPGMTEDDDHPFDPRQTPCPEPGRGRRYLLADAGRAALQQPVFSFSAAGAQAAGSAPTRPMLSHGLNSPIGRGLQLDGQVLLLGIDHTANTTIHWPSPYLACATGRKYVTLLQNGQPTRFDYGEIDHCCPELCPGGWLAGRPGFAAQEPWDARGRGWPARGTWWRW